MFSDDPANVRSLCLVVNDLPEESLGTNNELTARELAKAGWRVHILCCGENPRRSDLRSAASRLESSGISFSWVGDVEQPRGFSVRNLIPSLSVDRSERVRLALEVLHARQRFDLIEFGERGGLGFRAIQARRAGIAFQDVCMVVTLHGPTQWMRENKGQWMNDVEDLQVDYCERYTFDNADVQTSSSRDLIDYVKRIGWDVRDEARVNRSSVEEYDRLLWHVPAHPTPAPESTSISLVSVVIAHYNLGTFLPESLASLAAQSWPNLEVLVIDDGSTEQESIRVFEEQRRQYPQFRFLRQLNVGIGATRNRGLGEAHGEFFLCMDADNIAHPQMIERLATSLRYRPECSALSCYFLAFTESHRLKQGIFDYAYRPTGGSHVLGAIRNVYGDANAIYRTEDFRAVGGFESDRDTSYEDWEAFVKLVGAGYRVDVIPEHLFYYRHRPGGFSRITNEVRNRQRVLRQFPTPESLPLAERVALWSALCGFQAHLQQRDGSLRYRLVDKLNDWLHCLPLVHFMARGMLQGVRRLCHFGRGRSMSHMPSVSTEADQESSRFSTSATSRPVRTASLKT